MDIDQDTVFNAFTYVCLFQLMHTSQSKATGEIALGRVLSRAKVKVEHVYHI
jgi:hypothetical protein